MAREYKKRKSEFYDFTSEQLQGILKEVSDECSALRKAKKEKPDDVEIANKFKEVNNKRVRIYNRLRSLGVNLSEKSNGDKSIQEADEK